MARPEVWFAIPSASPERCRKTLPKWKERGYKIAVLQNVERGEIPADISVWSDHYPGWSASINKLCKEIVPSDAAIVVSGGCDMLPDPNFTAQELADQFFTKFPDGFGVMQPHGDEFANARHYCGSPFLGRRWIDTMYQGNGPMCGMYRHNWGDVELYWVAKCMGALWERPDLTHFHEHFRRDNEQGAKPRWWVENVEKNDRRDVELFISRSWTRFPGHEPINIQRTLDPEPLARDTVRLAEKHHQACYGGGGRPWYEREMTSALERCRDNGWTRVALYGAGSHTRRLGDMMMQPCVNIECIIDDNPKAHGHKLWGYSIVSAKEALRRGVQAVVLSSDAHEDRLWDSTAAMRAVGVKVLRVHGPLAAEKNARVSAALAQAATRGRRLAALYGAGAHTDELRECLKAPGVPVVCVIDDNPARAGQSIAGLPIHTSDEVRDMGVDCVILSSDRHEDAMWQKTACLREQGIEVIRLYAPALVQTVACETALVR